MREKEEFGGGREKHTLSAVLPVTLPNTDCAAPAAESMYDCRVEVFLSDMFAFLLFRKLERLFVD